MASLPLDEHAIRERFIRASGPGGQNVNKVATAVELRFDVAASSLPATVKARLIGLASRRMHADGCIVIDSRAARSQKLNREAARERLAALIERARKPPVPRRATKPPKASREARLVSKKQVGSLKAARRRPSSEE
ncbi:MAG: alternative ribosome rescue aminoacyl-tRNA hydrolase ArfB [Vicinamibacterales bacterium]